MRGPALFLAALIACGPTREPSPGEPEPFTPPLPATPHGVTHSLDLNTAQLRLDLERMMQRSCMPKCVSNPSDRTPPANVEPCWTCANPRLMLKREQGGYLEDVLSMVAANLDAAANDAHADLDREAAMRLMLEARAAIARADFEGAFSACCRAYSLLPCAGITLSDS